MRPSKVLNPEKANGLDVVMTNYGNNLRAICLPFQTRLSSSNETVETPPPPLE